MPPPVDDESRDDGLVLRIVQSAGSVSVRAGRGPGRRDVGQPGRRDGGSLFRQRRSRIWHLIARAGLTCVVSFPGLELGEEELSHAARRLRDQHNKRFDCRCDYVLISDGWEPATVHVFALPYPDEDIDVVTGVFQDCAETPEVHLLVDDPEELKDTVYQACEGLRLHRSGVDLYVMSRTGIDDVSEFEVDSLETGLDFAQALIAPHKLQVEQYQPFGKRPWAVAQFRPQIPIHEFKPRSS